MTRDLRLFFVFRLLATSYLWVPIFFFFMISRGLGFDEIMILSAIYSIVVILVEVPTGAFADRIGRRQAMMAGALSMVASCLVAHSAHSFTAFAVAEVLAAISMSLCSGADSAYLFDLLAAHGKAADYPRYEGTSSAWHQGGQAAAFAAGGLLAEIDLALPYLVTAGVAALAFVAALLLGREPQLTPRPRVRRPLGAELRSYVSHMGGAMRNVQRSSRLLWIIAYSAVVFVLLRATIYLYQPYLDARGFGIAETGFVFAGVYLVATFVAHRGDALRRWLGEDVLMWGLLGTLAVSFALLNRISGEWALGLLAVQAVANGLYAPLVKPLLNREIVDSARRATVLSVESIARRIAMGVFSPIAGYYGAASAMYLCGGLGIAGFVLLALMSRHAPTGGAAVSLGAAKTPSISGGD